MPCAPSRPQGAPDPVVRRLPFGRRQARAFSGVLRGETGAYHARMGHVATDRASPVGRDAELAAIRELLTHGGTGFAALVLEGEPGIGKTTLWLAGLAVATELGYRVLVSRTAPSEATYSFAALGDLAGEVLDEFRPQLPAPQQLAIDVALLRVPAGPRAPERRAVATAALTLLRGLARSGPLLLAIDDVQWLDQASSTVLEFALRRMRSAPVRLMATRRSIHTTDHDLTTALDPAAVRRVGVGPLGSAALYQVLATAGRATMPRPLFVRILEASGGNPFFALEMARAIGDRSAAGSRGDPVPIPESLGVLVRG